MKSKIKINKIVERFVGILNYVLSIFNLIVEKNPKVRIVRGINSKTINDFLNKLWPIKSSYGLIRLGAMHDGGYLVPDDLQGIKYCFSPGVDKTIDFELDLASRGIKSFLADFSVNDLPIKNPKLEFTKHFIGNKNEYPYITLEEWMHRSKVEDENLLLQMDIEGAEYEVINSVKNETLAKYRILVIEFHNLHLLVRNKNYNLIKKTFEKICHSFEIVHIHPNNESRIYTYKNTKIPSVMEFTFHNKNRIQQKTLYEKKFPNPLDSRNNPNKVNIELPEKWFYKENYFTIF